MKIPQNIIEELIEQAEKDAPDESCGYLLGIGDEVTENYWMENIDHSSEHFSFAPKDQFAALRYVRDKGLKILANWHSLANDPSIRYAILSLLDGEPKLNSFKILNGEVVDKEVHL